MAQCFVPRFSRRSPLLGDEQRGKPIARPTAASRLPAATEARYKSMIRVARRWKLILTRTGQDVCPGREAAEFEQLPPTNSRPRLYAVRCRGRTATDRSDNYLYCLGNDRTRITWDSFQLSAEKTAEAIPRFTAAVFMVACPYTISESLRFQECEPFVAARAKVSHLVEAQRGSRVA